MALVSPTQLQEDDEVNPASQNTPINELANVINGNIDDNNISSISGTKVTDGSLTYAKIEEPIAFFVRKTASQSINNATTTKVTFDEEDYDYGSNWDTGDDSFTAPYNGVYRFTFNLLVNNVDSGNYWEARINTNTTNEPNLVRSRVYSPLANFDGSAIVTSQLDLNAGDKVWAETYHDNGDNNPSVSSTSSLVNFSGHLVGRT